MLDLGFSFCLSRPLPILEQWNVKNNCTIKKIALKWLHLRIAINKVNPSYPPLGVHNINVSVCVYTVIETTLRRSCYDLSAGSSHNLSI